MFHLYLQLLIVHSSKYFFAMLWVSIPNDIPFFPQMDHQEHFFKEQLMMIYNARNEKEDDFEKIQQEQREKVVQSQANPSSAEDPGNR